MKTMALSSAAALATIFAHADATDGCFMAAGLFGSVGSGLVRPLMMLIVGSMMNGLGSGSSADHPDLRRLQENANKNALLFLYVSFFAFAVAFLEGFCWTRTGDRQTNRMRIKYLKATLRQDVEYFDLNSVSMSDVITCVSSDSLIIQDVIGEKLPNFINNVAMFVGCYFIGFFLQWRLALIGFPTCFLLVIPGIIYGRVCAELARRIRAEYEKAGDIVEQAVSSMRTVYSFVAERRTITAFSRALDDSLKLGLRQGLTKGIGVGSNAIAFASWALVSWFGSQMVIDRGAKGGTVFIIGNAIVNGGLALGASLSSVKYFSEASAAGERIMRVIKRAPTIDSESDEGVELERLSGEVEFQAVKFAYPSRPENVILNGFSLKIEAGKTVALVGGSGSGKSTTIALLERFYDPLEGAILLDGVDVKKVRLKWLRMQIGLVSQEPALFATSIKQNLLCGNEDATMEEVIAAATAANAHSFISLLPQGYDTLVGEGGVQMSGGQKQRLAIARAMLRSPKILLLDEATSALDSESERAVQVALDQASVGRTTVVVAHRLSTVRNADVIAAVQDGRVVELGAHEDLIRENGLYSSLVSLQQQSTTPADVDGRQTSAPSAAASEVSSASAQPNECRSSERPSSSPANNPHVEADEGTPVPSLRRLFLLSAPEWKRTAMGCLGAICFGAVQPAQAFAMGSMVSVYFLPDDSEIRSETRTFCFIFLGIAVFSFVVNIIQHYNFGAMGEFLTKRVRENMFSQILTFEVGWFDRDENSTGAICARIANDANVVRMLVGDRTSLLVQTVSAVAIAWTMGVVIAWKLGLVLILVQPIVIACHYSRKMMLKKMTEKASEAQAEGGKLAAEAVSRLRTVTAFSLQDRIVRQFELAQEGPSKESVRQSWVAGVVLGISQFLMLCIWSLALWFGGGLMAGGDLTAAQFFKDILIITTTGRVIAEAASMTSDLARGADSIRSVFAVLDRRTQINPEDEHGRRPEKLTGAIEIINVDFAYPSRPKTMVLRGFSFSIAAGKSTALVGQSGSGKSTIIGLVERFYDPLSGAVEIDGVDVRSYHLRSLRRRIGLVGQEPALFAGTVRDNIAYGVEGSPPTAQEIEDAARAANAHGFISGLSDGYDTFCGDRGALLSGGQKQRIAIARAVLKNPEILLLDEATSALDSQSETVVQAALERLMAGRTSVVVAHRLSTVKNCDLIAVMEKGAVTEKGTHASLLALGPTGAYYGLISLQSH